MNNFTGIDLAAFPEARRESFSKLQELLDLIGRVNSGSFLTHHKSGANIEFPGTHWIFEINFSKFMEAFPPLPYIKGIIEVSTTGEVEKSVLMSYESESMSLDPLDYAQNTTYIKFNLSTGKIFWSSGLAIYIPDGWIEMDVEPIAILTEKLDELIRRFKPSETLSKKLPDQAEQAHSD